MFCPHRFLFLLIFLLLPLPAKAQIQPDATLDRPTRVTQNGSQHVIEGGTSSNGNLFHSFREFSVPNRQTASFRVAPDVVNVLTRVTGTAPSRIHGTIEVLQSAGGLSPANFFLLNPNGILFGRNAALNVGGSFLATTADAFTFDQGMRFSAVDPQPVLTLSVPVGLQFGRNPAAIVNRSVTSSTDAAGNEIPGLRVPFGQTIALVGGDVLLPSGILSAWAGQIELGSVTSADRAGLKVTGQDLQLDYADVQQFGRIRIFQDGYIDTSGDTINARSGAIRIRAGQLQLDSGGQVAAYSAGAANGAPIQLTAETIKLQGASAESASGLFAYTVGTGRGGAVQIVTQQLTIADGARLVSLNISPQQPQGSTVQITADTLTIADINRQADFSDEQRSSGIFIQTEGAGAAGRLSLVVDRLQVQSGGQINSTTNGSGSAGALDIRAREIDLAGVALNADGSPILIEGLPYGSGLFAGTGNSSSGNGANLNIQTQRLTLRQGAVLQTSTLGAGQAGRLQVTADDIEVSGTSIGNFFPTGILSLSGGIPNTTYSSIETATGRGGEISITTDRLTVRDGAVVATGSVNRSRGAAAGDLTIFANQINLDNRAGLLANTNSGDGGNLSLQVRDLLTLRRGSAISTSAGSDNRPGNGGRIAIDSSFVVAGLAENSDISADAYSGNGGDVTLHNTNLLGIAPQPRQTSQSDITAFSERGVSGQITLDNPRIDPTRGLTVLPITVSDAANLITRNCGTVQAANRSSTFVVTGRGGLPPSPEEMRASETTTAAWATLPAETANPTAPSSEEVLPVNTAIVEAQGWQRNAAGQVQLVAITAAPFSTSPRCSTRSS